jgi:Ca2+-binding RTX toxin-like protein
MVAVILCPSVAFASRADGAVFFVDAPDFQVTMNSSDQLDVLCDGPSPTNEVRLIIDGVTNDSPTTDCGTVTSLTVIATGAFDNTITLTQVTPTAFDNAPPVTVDGGAGTDILRGSQLNDQISGGEGNDTIDGGPGADVLDGGLGADVLNGDADIDTVTYATRTARVFASIGGLSDGEAGEGDTIGTTVESITGGGGRDVLRGSSAPNRLVGRGANDKLFGLSGRDILIGSSGGNDKAAGGRGRDRCRAERETGCEV